MKLNSLMYVVLISIITVCLLSYPVNAEIVFNESYYFQGGGTYNENIGSGGVYNNQAGGSPKGKILNIYIDFDDVKYIKNLTYANTFYADGIRTTSLGTGVTGINEQYVPFSASVSGGSYYGFGYLGWKRTTGNNFNYVLHFISIDNSYASTLTGKKTIDLTYDATWIYGNFTQPVIADNGYSLPAYSYTYVDIQWYCTTCDWRRVSGTGAVIETYEFTDTVVLKANNISQDYAYLNLTKYNTNNRFIITNIDNSVLYDVTSVYDVSQIFNVMNGLKINLYNIVADDWVNRSIFGIGGTPPIPEISPKEISINPDTGVGIMFDEYEYAIGDISNISWVRTSATPFGYHDYVVLIYPYLTGDVCDFTALGGTYCGNYIIDSPTDSGNTKIIVDRVGSYEVDFGRCLGWCDSTSIPTVLASDTAIVLAEQPSYLLVNSTVSTKVNVPITYFIGRSLTGYVTGNKSLLLLEVREYDGTDFVKPAYYNILNNNGTINHIFPYQNKYKVSLYDYLRDEQFYEKIITAIYIPENIPAQNILTSYITVDKNLYYYAEMITGTYGIDDSNYSAYNVVVSLMNETNGNVYCSYNAGENFDLKTGTYLYDFISQSGNYYMGCDKATGITNITLYRNNNSVLEKLTSVSFNISNTNELGYGLKISSLGCQMFGISAISPAVAKLEIVDYNHKIEKYFNFTGSLNIVYTSKTKAQYTFNIYDSTGNLQISKVIPGSSVCPVMTTTYPGMNGTWKSTQDSIVPTCTFWDNCVRGIFTTQGVNDSTRLLFAMFCIVVMMFFGMVASKGNFGVSVILGFLPYAFFSYLSISTPCGQYMPLWVTVFIALIIGIKMKWFT